MPLRGIVRGLPDGRAHRPRPPSRTGVPSSSSPRSRRRRHTRLSPPRNLVWDDVDAHARSCNRCEPRVGGPLKTHLELPTAQPASRTSLPRASSKMRSNLPGERGREAAFRGALSSPRGISNRGFTHLPPAKLARRFREPCCRPETKRNRLASGWAVPRGAS